MATDRKLTAKQQRFVDEYLVDCNATQAAIRAGYSKKTANVIAAQLLTKLNISHAIQARLKELQQKTQITQEYVREGLQEVAERCLQRRPVMVWDREERCLVQAKDGAGKDIWQFDSTGANRAFELLGKHLHMFDKLTPVEEDPNTSNVKEALLADELDEMDKSLWGDEDGEEDTESV